MKSGPFLLTTAAPFPEAMRPPTGSRSRGRPFAFLLAALLWTSALPASPKVHVVYEGQRLGSIAKRYNVTIDELCQANGISRKDKIFPGQKLIIPERGKPITPPRTASSSQQKRSSPASKAPTGRQTSGSGHPRLHIVSKGQTLGVIARRYGVSIDAICHATGISRRSVLKIGQRLIVPAVTDPRGEYARSLRVSGRLDHPQGPPSWERYSKAPWRRGYITIQGYSRTWKGYVLGPGQQILPKARASISQVLGVKEGGPSIDDRLIRLMAQVSDQFGGRPLRIVSGYRETSFVHDSKHKVGRALDFSIPGVPNEVLRDYCRTLGSVGVGYYPNSSFVHLDVRSAPAYWVDYAGPGEPPRKTPYARSSPKAPHLARGDSARKESPQVAEEPGGSQSDGSEPAEDARANQKDGAAPGASVGTDVASLTDASAGG